jgi:hypothetical protein
VIYGAEEVIFQALHQSNKRRPSSSCGRHAKIVVGNLPKSPLRKKWPSFGRGRRRS